MKAVTSLVCLAVLLRLTSAQALETIDVRVNDFGGLKQAIAEANERPIENLTRIRATEIVVPGDDSLPPISARVNLLVGVMRPATYAPDKLFHIESTAIVAMQGTRFVGWSGGYEGPILFENHGTLALRGVLFDSVAGSAICTRFFCRRNETAIIQNAPSGNLTLDDVLVLDTKINSPKFLGMDNRFLINEGTAEVVRTQLYLLPEREKEPFLNSGFMRMRNVSFIVRSRIHVQTLSLLAAAQDANTQVVNSVFDGFTGAWCERVTSVGHNTTTAHDCNWTSSDDEVGVSTGLIWRRRYPNDPMRNHFDLVPSAASSVIDSADAAWCPEGSEIPDGNGDGSAICDRGALELKPVSVAEGGINGFYYNPEEDGHYVYVQETDFTTLVMWNTFDADGNQAWIYGTGRLEAGHLVVAEAYINRTGGLTPDGLVTDVEAEPWGELEVDMTSCSKGTVVYRSALPEFGSGQFPIERLAYVKQLGCVDPE